MMHDKIATVKQIGLLINTVERRGAENLERSVALMTSVLEARKRHSLPLSFGVDALTEAAAAAHAFAQGNRAIAACHEFLASDQVEFGVPRMTGDECPWPSIETDGRAQLKAVA